jgi:hypothetical protein
MKYVKYGIRVTIATLCLPFFVATVAFLSCIGLVIMVAMWAFEDTGRHNIYKEDLWEMFIDFFKVYKLP